MKKKKLKALLATARLDLELTRTQLRIEHEDKLEAQAQAEKMRRRWVEAREELVAWRRAVNGKPNLAAARRSTRPDRVTLQADDRRG